ncbi:MAG: hypothetical protein IPG05_15685 [Gemmatimonadetes bacterium]|nr:hypothetical protein [Gemmatimonadota bacterium]
MIESLRYPPAEKQADLRRVMAATIAARPDSVASAQHLRAAAHGHRHCRAHQAG